MFDLTKMNYNKIYALITVLLFLLVGQWAYGQKNDDFRLEDVTETIDLNTDRDIYFAGEEILFSAEYFINHLKVTPIISNVIYIELINCFNNNPVLQKKYEITDFNANGSIKIPKEIASGNYMLRAYTQYQRNFSYLNYSYHFITILNPVNNENLFTIDQNNDSIEIVAEGNTLLDNIKNNVVIRIPKHLLAVGNEYYITDGALNIVEKVEVSEFGFAQIEIVGNFSANNNFLIKKSNGDSVVKAFPKVQMAGIQTQTKLSGDDVEYLIQTKGVELLDNDLNYQIKVLANGYRTVYKNNITLSNFSLKTKIAKEILSDGINYIVLTDVKGNVLKVNSVFIQSKSVEEIDIITEKDSFARRENIDAHIALKRINNTDLPVVSVNVTKHGTRKEDHKINPTNYFKDALLLCDYLSGNAGIDSKMRKQIFVIFDKYINKDLFEELLKSSKTNSLDYIPETRNLTISGLIRNKKTLDPVTNQNIYLSVLFNNPQLHICKSNDNGGFIFSLNNVNGINDIFLCPENDGNDEYEILITNSFSSEIPNIGEFTAFIDSAGIELINDIYINAQINQNFNSKLEKEPQQRVQNQTFNIDNNKSTTLLADFVTLKNMEELFTEIVPSAKFRKDKGQYSFSVFDANGNILSDDPLLLFDKIPVFDANKIMHLDISLIEKVEVINKTYVLGENTFHGVIMLTSKTKNFAGIEFPKSSVFIEYPAIQGLHDSGLFVKDILPVNERIPYFMTTLFWDPNIKLNASGNDFNFKASDSKGTYDIIVKGYSSSGQTYYGRKQIFVE